jgi:CheY-like chemotaxis protein
MGTISGLFGDPKTVAGQSARDKADRVAAGPAVPQRKLNILLAEDVDVNAMIATRFLGRLGHNVTVAENGIEALQKLEDGDFDLVLMDVEMPEMDGMETTRRIRQQSDPEKHRIPVIAMTAHAVTEIQQRCLEAGMNDYITKPLEPETLKRVLEKYQSG